MHRLSSELNSPKPTKQRQKFKSLLQPLILILEKNTLQTIFDRVYHRETYEGIKSHIDQLIWPLSVGQAEIADREPLVTENFCKCNCGTQRPTFHP